MGVKNTADYLIGAAPDDAIAFVDDDRAYSYAELRGRIAGLTEVLQRHELPRGSAVVLVAANGLFWIAGYLAVIRAGLVAVPLPTVLGPPELAARAKWVGARAVLADALFTRRLASALPPGVALVGESEMDRSGQWNARQSPTLDSPDRDAVYLFTSGTTGTPRAVRLTHRNIQANTDSILRFLPIDSSDRALVVLPFSYVFGASVLHTHLRAGATLVNQRMAAFAESTAAMLESERCTGLAGVPSVMNALMRTSTFPRRELPHLRTIQQAGGRMSPAILQDLLAAHPHAHVYVMYGQTEASARLSYLPPSELRRRPGSIGRGIPGVQLRVVAEGGHEVQPGEIGEVYARGDNISPGYLGDEALSAVKMPGGELHTGDLATVDDEGFIYIVDRAEDFIKSWGFRVASQEIEMVAMQLPDVVAAAAFGVPDDAAGERVCLAVVFRSGAASTTADVLAHCRATLPTHMIPQQICAMPTLPLNANGKVLKRAVREMFLADTALSAATIPSTAPSLMKGHDS